MVDQPPVRAWRQPVPCKDCGGLFDPKWPSSRRCEACHQNRLLQPDCSPAKCLICGKTFLRIRGNYARRCDSCIEAKAIPPRAPETGHRKAEARAPRSGLCISCGLPHGRFLTAKRCLTCAAAKTAEARAPCSGLCISCGLPHGRYSTSKRCLTCAAAKTAEARAPRSGLCISCGLPHGRYPTSKRCLACAAVRDTELHRESRKRNQEAARSRKRAWRADNAERHRASHAAWKAANRGRLTEYKRDYDNHRKRKDHVFKLVMTVRSRVATALRASRLKGQRVTARGALRYLGCPFDDFVQHIESQFTDGMSWENFGRGGWHVDHIYPLGRANLTDPVELLAAFNWRNCRPLWGAENMIKQATVTPEAAALFAELKTSLAGQQLSDGFSPNCV